MLECPRCGSSKLVTKSDKHNCWLGTDKLKIKKDYGWGMGNTSVPDDKVVCQECGYVFKPGWSR